MRSKRTFPYRNFSKRVEKEHFLFVNLRASFQRLSCEFRADLRTQRFVATSSSYNEIFKLYIVRTCCLHIRNFSANCIKRTGISNLPSINDDATRVRRTRNPRAGFHFEANILLFTRAERVLIEMFATWTKEYTYYSLNSSIVFLRTLVSPIIL